MVTMTPCGHWYCSPCMHSWLATSRTCPQCRTPVTVTDCATVTLKMPPLGPGSELVQRCVGGRSTPRRLRILRSPTPSLHATGCMAGSLGYPSANGDGFCPLTIKESGAKLTYTRTALATLLAPTRERQSFALRT
jgi:hypothetical protein